MNDTVEDIQTPYGLLSLDTKSDKKMVGVLKSGGYPNDDLLSVAVLFLAPGSVAVDIGAHVGTFSIPLARHVRVISFEPAPQTFALLQKNTARAQGSFDLRNKGLASAPGSAHLIERNASNAGAQTLEPGGDITISTLDAEVSHADFIKIDVEGMEEEILMGGASLIERVKPVVMFEVNLSQLRAHGSAPRVLQRFFKTRGYNLYVPLFSTEGPVLARVGSLGLLTMLIAPRAWVFHSDSAPFDIFAVPKEKKLPVPHTGFTSALVWAVGNNVRDKVRRLKAHLTK